ncbi:AraC family transcriptional regulator [Solimonas sp. K1W22B-7]|uniref:helix-turn-helix transcriptional regulator n=1 Tax=Solimonas sp. K1W22B-7 TaxID=2303331 RepID=UPI000E32EA92|nr:AraC family transcriptional regulator [Solimonas sp. K1W22B-7]AXQ28500.1 AraC family transcriptional regulator [Solimonas sp. K1W22B-7]
MGQAATASMTVDAEILVPAATVQLVRFDMARPADNLLRDDKRYWLDLCLTPRPQNARACYRDHWSPHRFERIGKVFLLPPGETMQARSDGVSSQASILCHLQPEALRDGCGEALQWTDSRLQASLDIRDASVRSLLLRLATEARHPGFASQLLAELIIGQLSIELLRYCARVSEAPSGSGLAAWRLRRIDERLSEVAAAPTLSELAALCRVSVRQLTRGFRQSRGCSLGEHVANDRVERAKRMLLGDESVKAVAYSLGFSSPSSFCFAFRRSTGVTPREFRQRAPRLAA